MPDATMTTTLAHNDMSDNNPSSRAHINNPNNDVVVSVLFCQAQSGETCPITAECIGHRETLLGLPYVPPDTKCALTAFPRLTCAELPCKHRFDAVALLLHFMRNGMQCPLCRAGSPLRMDPYFSLPDETWALKAHAAIERERKRGKCVGVVPSRLGGGEAAEAPFALMALAVSYYVEGAVEARSTICVCLEQRAQHLYALQASQRRLLTEMLQCMPTHALSILVLRWGLDEAGMNDMDNGEVVSNVPRFPLERMKPFQFPACSPAGSRLGIMWDETGALMDMLYTLD